LDDIIVFHQLTKSDLMKIVDLEVDKVLERVKAKEVHIVLENGAKEFLIEKGYDPMYGARPMRRAVERYLEDPLAEEILRSNVKPGDVVHVSAVEGKLVFKVPEAVPTPAGTSGGRPGLGTSAIHFTRAGALRPRLSSGARQLRACKSAWWRDWHDRARLARCAGPLLDRACAWRNCAVICAD